VSNLAPGAYINEVNSPSYTASGNSTTQAVFLGAHQQGPLTPVLVTSWAQFKALYGGFVGLVPSTLALGVYSFFNNGGGQAFVLRVVDSTAVTATGSIEDAAAAATLSIDAANPGAWGNSIYYGITVTSTTTFNLYIYYGGTATGNIVERWINLSMSQSDPRYAVAVVNSKASGSNYVVLADLLGSPGTPGPMPVATTNPVILGNAGQGDTAGSDGSPAGDADIIDAIPVLNTLPGPIAINAPGSSDTTVLNALINYCATQRTPADAMVVCDPPLGQTATYIINTFKPALTPSSYGVTYWPGVVVSDPASMVQGAQRTLAPGALALGQWAANDASRGVQKAPAGQANALSVLGLETTLSNADIGNLTAANVNAIRNLPGVGTVLWGARTLSPVVDVEYINTRRELIEIESNLLSLTAFSAFEPNDNTTWTQIVLLVNSYLNKLWAAGYFAGITTSESFYVTCDNTNNDPGTDTINVAVGVAFAEPNEFTLITITQFDANTLTAVTSASGVNVS
jgi:phage tail sheath protein FI